MIPSILRMIIFQAIVFLKNLCRRLERAEVYKVWPPKLFMVTISLIQILMFAFHKVYYLNLGKLLLKRFNRNITCNYNPKRSLNYLYSLFFIHLNRLLQNEANVLHAHNQSQSYLVRALEIPNIWISSQ